MIKIAKVLVVEHDKEIKFVDLSNILNLYQAHHFIEYPNKFFNIHDELNKVIYDLKEFFIKQYLPKNMKIWDGIEEALFKCKLIVIEIKIQQEIEKIELYEIKDNISLPGDNKGHVNIGNNILIKDEKVFVNCYDGTYQLLTVLPETIRINTHIFSLINQIL